MLVRGSRPSPCWLFPRRQPAIHDVQTRANNFGGQNEVTIKLLADHPGQVSFAYEDTTFDVDGAFFDPFGYLLNGIFNQVVPPPSLRQGQSTSGTLSFSVSTGDGFGFYARATDSQLGSSVTTVSDFAYQGIPGPFSVLGAAAAFGFSRRLRSQIRSNGSVD